MFGFKNQTAPNAYHRDDNPRLWSNLGNDRSALTFSAYWRGVNYLSGVIAAIPWALQKVDPQTGAMSRLRTHPIDRMLSLRANPLMSAFTARQTLLAHRITHGYGIAEIQKTLDGRPVAFWPIEPNRVTPKLAPDRTLVYIVQQPDGTEIPLMPENALHFPGLGFDGITSYSVLHYARRTIQSGISGDEFAKGLWDNAAMVGGIVSHPETLSDEAYQRLRDEFEEKFVGAANRGRPIIGEEGIKFTPMAIPPEDAQFIENRYFSIEEMARWLGIPPHKMMDNRNATYSNVEEQNLEVIGDTIVPIIESMEQEANFKLLGAQQKNVYTTQMDVGQLSRGNYKARADWLRAGFDMGGISPNYIAREFGEAPTEGGDERFIQMNLTTVKRASEEPEPAPAALPAEDPEPEADTERGNDPLLVAYLTTTYEAVERMHTAIAKRYVNASERVWLDKTANVENKSNQIILSTVERVCNWYGITDRETIDGICGLSSLEMTKDFRRTRKPIIVAQYTAELVDDIENEVSSNGG